MAIRLRSCRRKRAWARGRGTRKLIAKVAIRRKVSVKSAIAAICARIAESVALAATLAGPRHRVLIREEANANTQHLVLGAGPSAARWSRSRSGADGRTIQADPRRGRCLPAPRYADRRRIRVPAQGRELGLQCC